MLVSSSSRFGRPDSSCDVCSDKRSSWPTCEFLYTECRKYQIISSPPSVRRSMSPRPPSSVGPNRTAVGSLLLRPNRCTMVGIILDCIRSSSSSSTATAGREYFIAGAYIVRWNTRISVALSLGDRRYPAYLSAFDLSIWIWSEKSPSGAGIRRANGRMISRPAV